MPTVHLTDRKIRSLSTDRPQETFWDRDLPGFGVRVSGDTGLRTFVLRYRREGRRRRFKIGRYPMISLADARDQAKGLLGRVALGQDPAEERGRTRRDRKNGITVEELALLFLEKRVRPNRAPSTHREYQRILLASTGDVHSTLGHRKAEDITPEEVQGLLDSILERGAGFMANRTRAVLSSMFNWARGAGRRYVEKSPIWGVEKPLVREPKRERVLSPAEITTLWKALRVESPEVRGSLQLILLTGQRPSEVLSMEADDISKPWWTIPAGKRKGGQSHRIFLSPQSSQALAEVGVPNAGWVFSSGQARAGHYSVNSLGQAVSRRIRRRMEGVDRWTPHDLRRTCASLMGEKLKIPRDHRDHLVLGHADPTPGSHYDRASDYQDEIEEIFTRWGAWVEEVIRS